MKNEIYIKYMTDELLEAIKKNPSTVSNYMDNNKIDNGWLKKIYSGKLFVEKTLKIPDFELKLSDKGDYKEVDFENSVILYESLKDLPKYVLSDERFWAWINFEKCYEVALQAMPIDGSKTRVLNHYLFGQGKRRSLFFGVMSRCFYRVALTADDNLDDKYLLSRFVIANPQRFRELSWRAFSSKTEIVRGVIWAQKKAIDEYGSLYKSFFHTQIAKFVSRLGSVKLLDAMTESYVFQQTYDFITKLVQERQEIDL